MRTAIVIAALAMGCAQNGPTGTTEWYEQDQGLDTFGIQVWNGTAEVIGSWQLRLLEADNWIAVPGIVASERTGQLGYAPAGLYELVGIGETTGEEYTVDITLPPAPLGLDLPSVPQPN